MKKIQNNQLLSYKGGEFSQGVITGAACATTGLGYLAAASIAFGPFGAAALVIGMAVTATTCMAGIGSQIPA